MTSVDIVSVNSKKELKAFIDYKHDLFQDAPNYVPELFIAQRDMLTKGKHPSHQHLDFELFLAYRNNKICGRIAAIYNKNHNNFTNRQDGFFGFFDVDEDYTIAEALLDKVHTSLKNKGVKHIIGPVDYSTNDPLGLLVDGFEHPPSIMMTYAKPYNKVFLERFGFQKQMDLLAYWVGTEAVPQRVVALAERIEQRLATQGIKIRSINLKDFKNEVNKIREVYNAAWDKNWGFVPMTNQEFDYVAKDMKMIMDKDFVLVAEKEGKCIGFTLTVPNINEILIQIKRGRLFPTGIFKLLLKKSSVKSLRILTLGVIEEYRKLGIEACFYVHLLKKAKEKGYRGAEASWILETNTMMNRGLENINGELYKRYRLYQKELVQ